MNEMSKKNIGDAVEYLAAQRIMVRDTMIFARHHKGEDSPVVKALQERDEKLNKYIALLQSVEKVDIGDDITVIVTIGLDNENTFIMNVMYVYQNKIPDYCHGSPVFFDKYTDWNPTYKYPGFVGDGFTNLKKGYGYDFDSRRNSPFTSMSNMGSMMPNIGSVPNMGSMPSWNVPNYKMGSVPYGYSEPGTNGGMIGDPTLFNWNTPNFQNTTPAPESCANKIDELGAKFENTLNQWSNNIMDSLSQTFSDRIIEEELNSDDDKK